MHFDSKAFLLRKTRAKATSGDRMLFKMVFSSVERVRLQGGVVAPMYENVGQGRQTPPSPRPPPPTSLQPSVTLDIFRQMSNIIIFGVLFL